MAPDDDRALALGRRAFDTAADIGLRGPEMPQQVLIADDHPLMRSALAQAVTQAFPGVEVREAAGYEELRAELADASPELVLLDLHMPGMSGFIGLMMLRSEHPEIPVIVVSASEDAATIQRSIDYGASGFVPKSAPLGQVAEAIRAVLDGEVWLPATAAAPDEAAAAMAERAVNLTPQQLRVLLGMAEGKLNKQIAFELAIAEQTVKDHVTVILRKLGASNRTQAILVASQLALKPPPPLE
jgi:DNA-binding NarL/FixJ family response regulator